MNAEDLARISRIDWFGIFTFWAKPVVIIVIGYCMDKLLLKLHSKSKFIERVLSSHVQDTKRQILAQRIKTFRGLALQVIRTINVIVFIFFVFDSINVDPKPLLAGIGVVGLGLSLAAQNILRDFLNGLFIVIEDQFNVGDWVTIGSFSGTVETFTMRATRLRAADGRLIIIPNGTIGQVINSTKEFSVACVDVGVSYESDAKRVMEVLAECGEEAMSALPKSIIEKPKALGIMDFRESDILMRVTTRTAPGEQWAVERALRLIIKDRFDKEGIEIPYPQVSVHDASAKAAPGGGEAEQSFKSPIDA
ncbi:MAG: mechanosensitive ion channel family protein [Synergistaceae bacterium]|jgi:small conductance mechanosensitive channel|nr:mechanosensitive ion channel family protein [Synergistaceae bacterium]